MQYHYNHFLALCLGLPGWVGTRKKHSPTHIYPDHQSSLISFLHLLWSLAFSLVNLRAWQSFCTTSVQVLFGLPLGLAPFTSYSIHFFTQSLSSFRNTCPYHRNLFCHNTEIMSSNPSLSQLFTWNSIFYLNVTHPSDHSHLSPLKCHLIFFSYRPGLTLIQHTTPHTTVVQSAPHYQLYILIGKQRYQLPEFIHPIQILASTAASASPSTLKMSKLIH